MRLPWKSRAPEPPPPAGSSYLAVAGGLALPWLVRALPAGFITGPIVLAATGMVVRRLMERRDLDVPSGWRARRMRR